mgnify:CR=1 FL=1
MQNGEITSPLKHTVIIFLQHLIDLIEIEMLRIIVVTNPFLVHFMLRVIRIFDRLFELLKSPHTAYIFGRTAQGSIRANRQCAIVIVYHLFKLDDVCPAVAEIVVVVRAPGPLPVLLLSRRPRILTQQRRRLRRLLQPVIRIPSKDIV